MILNKKVRLEEVQKQRKLQGKSWSDLAENLPIQGNSLRVAFERGRVDEVYIEHVEGVLNIQNILTSQSNESASEYNLEQKEGAEFDGLSFEGKLKEIYGAILASKETAKENREIIRRDKSISEKKISNLQAQLFDIDEKLEILKNKRQLS